MKNNYYNSFLFSILGILFFVSCNSSEKSSDGFLLRLNLPEETVYHYKISNEQEMEALNNKMTLSNIIEVDYQKMKDSAGFHILQSTVTRVAVKSDGNNNRLNYDSKNSDGSGISGIAIAPLIKILNQSFLTYFNADGSIEKVERRENKSSFSPEEDSVLTDILGNSFNFFPSKKIKTGSSWEMKTREMEVQGISTKIKTSYTLDSVKNDTAYISSKGVISSSERELILNGVAFTISMKGTQSGVLKVFIPEGRLLEAVYHSENNSLFVTQGQELKTISKGKSTIISEKK